MDDPLPRPGSDGDTPESPPSRGATFLRTVRAVAWSFLGIRRAAAHAQDVERLKPVHVALAALLGAALFVLLLVLLVHWVVASGAAH